MRASVRASSFPDLPGARESNAGDNFHILWAVSRCLKLIDPASQLTAVLIEDVSPSDRAGAGPRVFLTADVTQYYGGDSFASADRVEISQLKYSHRHPELAWTAARLAPAGQDASKSTLGKLASAFGHLVAQHGRESVVDKLSLQLVSNQPVSGLLHETVSASQALLSEHPRIHNTAALEVRLANGRQRDELKRLHLRSGLKSREFVDFLQVLDLAQTGVADRFGQQARIVQTLGRHVLGDLDSELNNLYQLVQSQAMPETSGHCGLKRPDILARLGFTEWHALPDVETIAHPHVLIDQPAAAELARVLASTTTHKVLAHGAAGVGKSTTILQLEHHLPDNSSLVIFDCFAGGAYRTPGERRHTPQTAIHTLINQLAIKCGTPFLVKNDENEEVLWRHFRSVLTMASREFAQTGSHLVLAIDAADNSVVAARERGERSFVHDLWKIDLPPNVHLVMSCRTGRRAILDYPVDVTEFELHGFDIPGSAAHLRVRFPDAADEICERFHLRSDGNPRAQAYVLNPQHPGRPLDAATCAGLVTPTPNDQFESLIETATDAAPTVADAWLAIVVAMQPPVRIDALAAVLDVDTHDAKEFCRALEPGVKIEHDTVSFRDEDFEAFVRERFDEARTRCAHSTIAERLFPLRKHAGWAAAALGEHLAAGGDAAATIDLALDDGSPTTIEDPAARTRVHLRRIALALQVSPSPSRSDACRLIALASQLRRTNDAIGQLVREHPDLALRFADPIEVARAHADDIVSADGWDGPAHFRLAVIAAETGDADTAWRRFELGIAWLRRYFDATEDERRGWSFNAEHAAIAAEAVYRLQGPQAAATWLRKWRPPTFVEATAFRLVERLVAARLTDGLPTQIADARLRPKFEARLLASLYVAGVVAEPPQVRRVADALVAAPQRLESDEWEWVVNFLEMAVAAPIGRRRLLALFGALRPRDGGYAPGVHDLGRWREVLRAACLEAAVRGKTPRVDELVPERLLVDPEPDEDPKDVKRRADERDRLERALGANLEDYHFRAEAIVGIGADTLPTRALAVVTGLLPDPDRRYRGEGWSGRFHLAAKRSVEAVLQVGADPAPVVEVTLDVTEEDGTRPIETWLSLAQVLLKHPDHVALGLDLVERVERETADCEEPLYDKTDRLVRCAALCRGVDDDLARQCFERAIAAAGDFSDERAALLTLANTLATTSLAANSSLPPAELALRLRHAIEALEPFVHERDRLPWSKTLAGVLRLHAPTGVRTQTCWDERGVLALDSGIREVIRVLHESGQLDDLEALHVLRLAGESASIVDEGLGILDAARARGPAGRASVKEGIKWLARFIEMALPVNSRLAAAGRFEAWIEERKLALFEGADRMASIQRMAQSLPAESTYESPTSRQWFAGDDKRVEREAIVATLVTAASKDRVEDLPLRLTALRNNLASNDEVAEYLNTFQRALHPKDRISALNVLVSIPSDSDEWRHYSRVLGSAIAAWTTKWNTKPIRVWLESEYLRFVRERLPTLLGYDNSGLLDAIANGGWNRDELVATSIAAHLEEVGADRLMALAVHLGSALPPLEHEQTLLWALGQVTDGRTPSPPAGRRGHASSAAPADPDDSELLPALCWHLLGHADRRVRWRIAHLCVDRASADSSFVDGVFRHFDDRSSCGYYHDKTDFFWMSAQVWWLATVRRIAKAVELTDAQVDRIRRVATNPDWPHALLRELARRTLLDLDLDPDHELSVSNQPASCQVERRHVYGREGFARSERFNFDSMDAIPYWFQEIADIYEIPITDFLQHAEHWVVDELGFDSESVLSADMAWRKRYDYDNFEKRHGSEPMCEDLSTYLEWHVQFLVAGQLADAGTPMVVDKDEDSPDPWSRWMDSFINPTGGWWIADLRDPTPLEPRLHRPAPAEETWRDRIDDDFDRELFADDGVVVDSYLDVSYGLLYENCWVKSALVTPQSALALLLACTTTSHDHNWALPEADSYRDNAFDEAGFRLIGWVASRNRESTGLEKHDPLRRIDLSHAVPDATLYILRRDGDMVDGVGRHRRLGEGNRLAAVD